MKKYMTVCAALLVAVVALGQAPEKRYGVKSATVKVVTNMMDQKVESVSYFDDFGAKELTVMEMMGMKMTQLSRDGKMYIINSEQKQVQEMPAGGMGGADINFLNLTDQVKAANKIKEAGKETILGRECTKYTMESSQMGMTMSQTVWVWNGIVLKSLTDGGQFQFGNTATKLEENANIPASTFDIPKF